MHNVRVSETAANAKADAFAALMNGGYVRLYDGAQPADADAALGAAVQLAELQFDNPAFALSAGGVIVANTIFKDPDADATGIAAFYRLFQADGTTAMGDGTVGVAGFPNPGDRYDLEMNSINIQIHGEVLIPVYLHGEFK